MYEGFQERHEAVEKLFRDSKTGFLIVCSPTEPATDVAQFFVEQLKSRKMPLLGVIANQCHQTIKITNDEESMLELCKSLEDGLASDTSRRMVARMRSAHKRLLLLQEYEEDLITKVAKDLENKQFLQRVPKIQGEVHDLYALNRVGGFLFKENA